MASNLLILQEQIDTFFVNYFAHGPINESIVGWSVIHSFDEQSQILCYERQFLGSLSLLFLPINTPIS